MNQNRKNSSPLKPPRWAEWILKRWSFQSDAYSLLDDLEIEFLERLSEKGYQYASAWYVSHLIHALPELVLVDLRWRLTMFNNYLKIALRNIRKHKAYAFYNIFGLALGMTCCLLITLSMVHELSYNRFHENVDHLYAVQWQDWRTTAHPLAPAIKAEVPEIMEACRYFGLDRLLIQYRETQFYEDDVDVVDPSFFQMFSFPFISGNRNQVFANPLSIVLTERMAEKYFGNEDAFGKTLVINNEHTITVTGIVKNSPDNSSIQFDMIIPYQLAKMWGETGDAWGSRSIRTYVQLHNNSVVADVINKVGEVRHKYFWVEFENEFPEVYALQKSRKDQYDLRAKCQLISFKDFHFHRSGKAHIYIFSSIAFFVLLIACFNFMNLSTARSANRLKEIGLRKVIGAKRVDIIRQFYGESILFSVIGFTFALLFVALVLPFYNTLVDQEIALNMSDNCQLLFIFAGITLITGLLAGSYPALYLSSFKPVVVMKGILHSGKNKSGYRNMLVVIQFLVSIFLIISTTVFYHQLDYMRNKDLGFEKEHVLYFEIGDDHHQKYEILKKEFLKDSRILGVAASSKLVNYVNSSTTRCSWDGKDPDKKIRIRFNMVDFDFTETMQIELIEGRSFSNTYPTDATQSILVNEEVVKLMGKKFGDSIIGESITFGDEKRKIIGVMKNFHWTTLRREILPLVHIVMPANRFRVVNIRILPDAAESAIQHLESVWARLFPDYPFEYFFLDARIDRRYSDQKRTAALFQYFAVMAVIIACLGLLGLASYAAERRTKEIGVRKVLGASVSSILTILTKDFLKLIIIANLIAWPIAYVVVDNWLKNFAYRINLSIGPFLFAGITAILIALLTVSRQAIKAATADPVNSLRYE